ncbi:MAG: LuxR C-terminal-related transcriptional regulator [Kibdelosporangium sp.]
MLYGRSAAQAAVECLITGARDGHSGALVLRGEPGIGKSALLAWAAGHAARTGLRVLRVTGIEGETDLAFAGLVQLLWPVQDRIGTLSEPQAAALRAVLGSGRTGGQDRFLIGLAVLTLLADLADDGPVLCLVDDAHWLDQATADAFLFAARRFAEEGVAMVFAAREEGFAAPGITEFELPRLADADAARLVAEHGLALNLRDQVIAESAGNPLALIEFAAAQRGHPAGPVPLPIADRVLASFRAQISRLPERTRLMMVIAAAEARGDLPMLLGAAATFGVGLGDLGEAETARLLRVSGTTVTFRHPLIATASYQGAVLARRVAVHQALADAAQDPDCRIRHLAAATMGPDEGVAAELVQAAERARCRTGYAAAAGFYEQAAQFTPVPRDRAGRLGQAASLAFAAGHTDRAGDLAGQAEQLIDDPQALAGLPQIRAAVEFELGEPRLAARLLIERAAHADPAQAAAMLRTSAGYAWFCGDTDSIRLAARMCADIDQPDLMVAGMAHLVGDDYARGLPLLADVVDEGEAGTDDAARARAVFTGMLIGDDAATLRLAAAEVARCRRQGLIGAMPQLLQDLAGAQVRVGRLRDAEATVAEAAEIAKDTGLHQRIARLDGLLARIAAIEGDEQRCRRLAGDTPDAGGAASDSALILLDVAIGDYESVVRRFDTARRGPGRHTAVLMAAVADQVEAAVRLGRAEQAEQPLRRFEAWAQAGRQPWALAVALRCRALLSEQEQPYTQALRLHLRASRPFEQARTELLYGEWLRRARRRSDARDPLRSALATFERLRAKPWAQRARTELQATGESIAVAQPAAANMLDRLTPQELQVVRLAADGDSSREIAAALFLSPRTVEHHLYKAYPKLGVGSRRELSRLDLSS